MTVRNLRRSIRSDARVSRWPWCHDSCWR